MSGGSGLPHLELETPNLRNTKFVIQFWQLVPWNLFADKKIVSQHLYDFKQVYSNTFQM